MNTKNIGKIKGKYCQTCGRHESEFDKWDSGSNGALKCRECGNQYRKEYKRKHRVKKKRCCRCNKTKKYEEYVKLTKGHTRICISCYKKGVAQLEQVRFSSIGTTGNMIEDGYYLCNICDNIKPLKAFYKNSRNKSGVKSSCKSCSKIREREKKLKYTYGLSLEDYNSLYELQDGNCAVCKNSLKKGTNDCSVDHDHETEEIRGLLCNTCNRALGMLNDNKQTLYSAIRYLKNSPFKKLGEFRESLEIDDPEPSNS